MGALTLDVGYWMHPDVENEGLMFRVNAMAVDRVPGTFVGRFGELRAGVGVDFNSDLLPYEFSFKLGVGLGTDYFVLFMASGLNLDAFQSLGDSADAKDIPFGAGIPLVLGLWITPMDAFHIYAMVEPAWYFGVESRQVTVEPIDIGEEMKSRLGLGFNIQGLEFRLEYTHYQVAPTAYHLFSIGAGIEPEL